MKTWIVPYRIIRRGSAEVEAETAEGAVALVDAGMFEEQPLDERTDWGATGPAEEVK
jgi:hypothetical protein